MHIYGCPMHYGVGDEGLTTSLTYLTEQYSDLHFPIISEITKEEQNLPNLKHLNSVVATCDKIASYAFRVLQNQETPLFIAGDHSSVMGSVSASSEFIKEDLGDEIGLIWVDAHPDINTDKTTVTGNIHGMPVAALLGLGEKSLTGFLSERPKLKPENIVMLGLRDIDPPEQIILDELNIRYYTYEQICARGLDVCLNETIAYLSHLSSIHISFDIDSMNPDIMPGVSVPVPDGFTVPEVQQIFQTLVPVLPFVSYDIVEYNHTHDKNDMTADFLHELVEIILKLNNHS